MCYTLFYFVNRILWVLVLKSTSRTLLWWATSSNTREFEILLSRSYIVTVASISHLSFSPNTYNQATIALTYLKLTAHCILLLQTTHTGSVCILCILDFEISCWNLPPSRRKQDYKGNHDSRFGFDRYWIYWMTYYVGNIFLFNVYLKKLMSG